MTGKEKELIRLAIEALRWALNSLDEQAMQEGCLKALKHISKIEGINL